jgi:hypothetical protein
MKGPRLPKLDPTSWAIILAMSVIAFVGLGVARPTVLGFQFDPFGLDRRKIENLTEERDVARSDASARGLEVEGERAQTDRVDAHTTVLIETRTVTAEATAAARSAPDANDLLPADRGNRLRNADRRMCELAPAVCAATSADPAGGGASALSSAHPAESGDAG